MSRNSLVPPGSAVGIRHVLLAVLFGAIYLLPIWSAPRFGVDPTVAWLAVSLAIGILFILVVVPVRVSAESRTVFQGTPEQLFQIASDIKLSLKVDARGRRLLSQTGQPGQPGSSYVTEDSRGVVSTTTVVSSDPPRKLVTSVVGRNPVTTTTGPTVYITAERTYTPVAEGTLLEVRTRRRGPPLFWLSYLLVFKGREKAEAARSNARISDYLAASVANTRGVGN